MHRIERVLGMYVVPAPVHVVESTLFPEEPKKIQ